MIYFSNNPLKIDLPNRSSLSSTNFITKNKRVFFLGNQIYFVRFSRLSFKVKDSLTLVSSNRLNISYIDGISSLCPLLRRNIKYGGEESLIVDMQNIHSFLYGRSKIFEDSVVRLILVTLRQLNPKVWYLRIGASGTPESKNNRGGEVLEYSLVNGENGEGVSKTQCGYLAKNSLFSKKKFLTDLKSKTMCEKRALYSHTAWLSQINRRSSENICFSVDVKEEGVDLLEALDIVFKTWNVRAYSIQLFVKQNKKHGISPLITGRVLKRLPRSRIKTLSHAANIASEQKFNLHDGQSMILYGTNYNRICNDWEEFRQGKPYEQYGHIHGEIISDKQRDDQHNLFHLRKLVLFPGNSCQVILTPIRRIVNIEPVILRDNKIISKLNRKPITYIANG